jgi:hypothetical protein
MVQTFVCSHWRSISLIHVRHSSKNWTSTTLTSGPRSENERAGSLLRSSSRRRKSNRSRSVSRSSNSNSPSRASSQDPSHKSAYYPKSQLKHTVSLSALEPLKDSLESKPKLKAKHRKNKPVAQPLASPFVSRASSPVATHIPMSHENQRRDILFSNIEKRTALAETFVDSNVPAGSRPTSRSRSRRRKSPADVPRNNDDAPKSSKSRHSPSPEHPENAKRRHTRGGEISNPLKRDLAERRLSLRLSRKQNQDRERRPSAPSSLLRSRPRPLPFRVPVPAGDEDIPRSNPSSKKHRLASGLDVILGPPIHHDDPGLPKTTAKPEPTIPSINTQAIIPHPIPFAQQKRRVSAKDEDSDAAMAWMHRRSGVNFNRPPSQMEFLGPSDGISGLGFGMGLDDPVFTSDDDELSDEAVVDEISMVTKGRVGRRLDLSLDLDGERFGDDAWGISTPFKGVNIENNRRKPEDQQSQELHRGQGSAGRLNSQLVPPKSPLDFKADDDEDDEGQDQDDTGSGEDMDLTASATFGYLEAIAVPPTDQHGNLDEGDMTPWITDSLISPPTVYLEKEKVRDTAAGEIKAGRGGEQEGKTTLASTTHLSSPFRLTSPTGSSTPFTEVTENEQYESKDQEDKAVIEKQFNQDTATATGSTKVTNAPTNKRSTRTRSGTIVPANPMPPGARRTRSGTIVGPLAAPPPPPPSNKVFVGSTRRTRSGTIVANTSSITGTQAPGENRLGSQSERIGRARSGSMLKMKDRQIQPRPTANSEEDDIGARVTATPNKDPLPRNTSINDAEFEFDADSESEDAVECFADSLYVPRRSSSPDPIDFLRFASIEEGDDEVEHLSMEFAPGGGVGGMRWCVAEEPPSPEVQKKQGSGRGGRLGLFGGILRGRGKRGEKKVSKNLRARFMGEEEIQPRKKGKEKETEMEDDELLLLPGDSARLWI